MSDRNRIVAILCFSLCTLALLVATTTDAFAARTAKRAKDNPKYASLVMEMETGKIISSSNPDKIVHPASLTKIMTLMMAFDAMNRGLLTKNDRIIFSKNAAAKSPSKIGIGAGKSMRVDDAIKTIVTLSANDAATALGEHLSGSEAAFARAMTAKARAIGMSKTTFRNASGLPDPGQVTTAHDMALLGRYLISHYPTYYRYFGTVDFSYNGRNLHNHNRLLGKYQGMDGIKTGFINASGFNLVASAKRGNTRLIGVVFGGRSWQSRNAHMVDLLDSGFAEIKRVGIAAIPAKGYIGVPGRAGAVDVASNDTSSAITGSSGLAAKDTVRVPVPSAKPVTMQEQLIAAAYEPAARSPLASRRDEIARDKKLQVLTAPGKVAGNDNSVPVIRPDAAVPTVDTAALSTRVVQPNQPIGSASWAIQIGAFQSRAATDLALQAARDRLPQHMANVQAEIVPYRTAQAEWIFRARLRGFNQDDATSACRYFADCLTISPGGY